MGSSASEDASMSTRLSVPAVRAVMGTCSNGREKIGTTCVTSAGGAATATEAFVAGGACGSAAFVGSADGVGCLSSSKATLDAAAVEEAASPTGSVLAPLPWMASSAALMRACRFCAPASSLHALQHRLHVHDQFLII